MPCGGGWPLLTLAALPDDAAKGLVADNDIANYGVVRVADEIVWISSGVTWSESDRERHESIVVEGMVIPVPTKQRLIRTKNAHRPADAADVLCPNSSIGEKKT